jgi:hypothetical protein
MATGSSSSVASGSSGAPVPVHGLTSVGTGAHMDTGALTSAAAMTSREKSRNSLDIV